MKSFSKIEDATSRAASGQQDSIPNESSLKIPDYKTGEKQYNWKLNKTLNSYWEYALEGGLEDVKDQIKETLNDRVF